MVHRLRQRRLLAQIFSLPYVDTDVYRRMAVNIVVKDENVDFGLRPGTTGKFFSTILLFQRNGEKIFACQKKTFINYVMKVARIDPV